MKLYKYRYLVGKVLYHDHMRFLCGRVMQGDKCFLLLSGSFKGCRKECSLCVTVQQGTSCAWYPCYKLQYKSLQYRSLR